MTQHRFPVARCPALSRDTDLPFVFITTPLLSYIGEGNATHSSVLAWRIPGTGEPGGLPSVGLHRVRDD